MGMAEQEERKNRKKSFLHFLLARFACDNKIKLKAKKISTRLDESQEE
jgi:hypothetical protein